MKDWALFFLLVISLILALLFSSCLNQVKTNAGGNAQCFYGETLIFSGTIAITGDGEENFTALLTGIHRLCSESSVWCQIDFTDKGSMK